MTPTMTPSSPLPPSKSPAPPQKTNFKYEFLYTKTDARNELTVELKNRVVRISYWLTGVVIGAMFLAVGLRSQHGTDAVFLILAGVLTLCALVLFPAYLWLSVPAPQPDNKANIEIDSRGVLRRSDQQGEIFHTWFIFTKTIRTGGGLGLFFLNQPPIWIPRRVFADNQAMEALDKYLARQHQLTQASMSKKPV